MQPLPTNCPICGGEITVTRINCNNCGSSIEGHFSGGVFPRLSNAQIEFIETFVRCEGKITRMETELGLSYPTIKNRLHEVIRALGYEPGETDTPQLSDEERRQILEDLDQGKITYEDAMHMLEEGE